MIILKSGTATPSLAARPRERALVNGYALAPGHYTLTVQDVGGTARGCTRATSASLALPAEDVYLNSPTNNSTWSATTVPISAEAYEQNGSNTPLVDHIEVWDRYAWQETSRVPYGVGVNPVFINPSVTFPKSGTTNWQSRT